MYDELHTVFVTTASGPAVGYGVMTSAGTGGAEVSPGARNLSAFLLQTESNWSQGNKLPPLNFYSERSMPLT